MRKIWLFLLASLFCLNTILFSASPAFAFTSLNACLTNPECAAAIGATAATSSTAGTGMKVAVGAGVAVGGAMLGSWLVPNSQVAPLAALFTAPPSGPGQQPGRDYRITNVVARYDSFYCGAPTTPLGVNQPHNGITTPGIVYPGPVPTPTLVEELRGNNCSSAGSSTTIQASLTLPRPGGGTPIVLASVTSTGYASYRNFRLGSWTVVPADGLPELPPTAPNPTLPQLEPYFPPGSMEIPSPVYLPSGEPKYPPILFPQGGVYIAPNAGPSGFKTVPAGSQVDPQTGITSPIPTGGGPTQGQPTNPDNPDFGASPVDPSVVPGASFTRPNFLSYALTVFSAKFPLDIVGSVSGSTGSTTCPYYEFYGEQFELCFVRDAVRVLKIPIIVSVVISSLVML